jgi:hypothetical protein
MVSEMTLWKLFRVHHGARRWVYLVYALILSGVVLLRLANGRTVAGLWPCFVVISVFVFQSARPTVAGWVAALVVWLGLWLIALVMSSSDQDFGALGLLFVVALALASSAPLYIFRPQPGGPATGA